MFKKAAARIVTTGILPAPKTPGCDYTISDSQVFLGICTKMVNIVCYVHFIN